MNRDQIRSDHLLRSSPEAVTQGITIVEAVNGKVASATPDQLNTSSNL